MDEDQAVEVGRFRHGPGWVAMDWLGPWCWYATKPVIEGDDNCWKPSPDDPLKECYEIGFSGWTKYWRDSLREVT